MLPSSLMILAVPDAQAQLHPQITTRQHSARITQIAVDRKERWMVTASEDRTARVWNLKTGELAQVLRPPIDDSRDSEPDGRAGRLYAVAITPDGEHVAVGGDTGSATRHPIYLFDRASGTLLGKSAGFSNAAFALRFSRNGERLAAVFAPEGGLRLLDARNLTELAADSECRKAGYGVDFDRLGRLVTGCYDGAVRLYDAQGRQLVRQSMEGSLHPGAVRFSRDGRRVAVGFDDMAAVAVLSGDDLTPLYTADTGVAQAGSLGSVTWSYDGRWLYAGGTLSGSDGLRPVVGWPFKGQGPPVLLGDAPATASIVDMAGLRHGRLLFASADPAWFVLGREGELERALPADRFDFSYQAFPRHFRVSPDGLRIEIGLLVRNGGKPAQFIAHLDLATRTFKVGSSDIPGLIAPRTEGLPVTGWDSRPAPRLDGMPLSGLSAQEISRSLSIAGDLSGFVLGTQTQLRSFDAAGYARWHQSVPAAAWAVNQSDDGRFVLAACGDGTVRWYDAATGQERLALFVHPRDLRWVLFTPEGFYEASPGGEAFLAYLISQGPERESRSLDAAQLSPLFYRPDLISARLAGDEAAIARALGRIGDVLKLIAQEPPPTVTLLSPAVMESKAGQYELRARVTPAAQGTPVGELRVYVNGAAVLPSAVSPPGGGVITQRLWLAPGANTVSLQALRMDGKMASNEVTALVTVHPRKAAERSP